MTDTLSTKDPVCGMTVDPLSSVASELYEGTTYHFCSDDCRQTFAENPAAYV